MDIAYQEMCSLRLSRDDLEKWVRAAHGYEDLAKGCFVKVLLEGEADRRKYRIARIDGYETASQPYVFGNLTSTARLLNLNFGPFVASYQMNTISNSPMSQDEVDDWVKQVKPNMRPSEWADFVSRKRTQLAAFRALASTNPDGEMDADVELGRSNTAQPAGTMLRRANAAEPEAAAAAAAAPVEQQVKRRLVEKEKQEVPKGDLAALLRQKDAQLAQKDLCIRQLQEQLSLALMPVDLDKLSLAELTAVEAKAEEYRQRVRALLAEKSKCSICMERESSIIFYPCKHAITCEGCSQAVTVCPLCRAAIQDRIKPFK